MEEGECEAGLNFDAMKEQRSTEGGAFRISSHCNNDPVRRFRDLEVCGTGAEGGTYELLRWSVKVDWPKKTKF